MTTVSTSSSRSGEPARSSRAAPTALISSWQAASADPAPSSSSPAAQVPEYRAVLDRENATGPQEVALIGDEHEVTAALRRLAATGITEFVAAPVGTRAEQNRTTEFLRAHRPAAGVIG